MRKGILGFYSLILLLSNTSYSQQFTRHVINSSLSNAYWVYATDIDGDGDIDSDDVSVFVAVLIGAETGTNPVAVNDLNGDGAANGHDIPPFVTAMLSP